MDGTTHRDCVRICNSTQITSCGATSLLDLILFNKLHTRITRKFTKENKREKESTHSIPEILALLSLIESQISGFAIRTSALGIGLFIAALLELAQRTDENAESRKRSSNDRNQDDDFY